MTKNKGRNKLQQKTWEKNHNDILEAVRKIEKRNEKAIFSKISKQLKIDNSTLTDGVISKHLAYAVNKRELFKDRRFYSSRLATYREKIVNSLNLAEVYDVIPQFLEFKKIYERLRAKSNIPECDVRKQIEFVKRNSEINIFSKSYLNVEQKEILTQRVFALILELLDNRIEPSYEDVSLNIIISYNAEKIKNEKILDLTRLDDAVTKEDLDALHHSIEQKKCDRQKIKQRKANKSSLL